MERKNEILKWISENESNAEIAKRLNCKVDTLKSYYKKMNIEYKGNQGRKGSKHGPKKKSFEELVENSSITSHKLRLRLIEEGIKEHKCECCNNTEWNGLPIPLELHHINGIHSDNNLSNLQILCPNCHAQTSNFSSKKR